MQIQNFGQGAACKLGTLKGRLLASKQTWTFEEESWSLQRAACKHGLLVDLERRAAYKLGTLKGGLLASKSRLGTFNRELELGESCLQTLLHANLEL